MDVGKKNPPELELHNLRATELLGKGATGTVFLVHHCSQRDHPFALKVVEKSPAAADDCRRARHEISVLRRLSASHNPFLPHLIGSSENQDFICWAIPFCPGGDLNVLRHRQSDGIFSPAVIRFYLAEIISAVEHLHGQGIAYRDLKPENVLVQQSGHATLTDFDLSRDLVVLPDKKTGDYEEKTPPEKHQRRKHLTRFFTLKSGRKKHAFISKAKSARVSPGLNSSGKSSFCHARGGPRFESIPPQSPSYKKNNDFPTDERSNSFVGTEEYVAPEILRGDGHEFSVDWWALGVLSYEMLYGATPFKGRSRKETFRKILLTEPEFIGKPNALTDLIRRLLEKDPTRRLGWRGAGEIKEHEFFRGLRWDLVTEVLRPPFLPSREEAVEGDGVDIWEYFERLNCPSSPLWSPSPENCRHNVSLTDF